MRLKGRKIFIALSTSFAFYLCFKLFFNNIQEELSVQACRSPRLDPDNAEVRSFFHHVNPIECNSDRDWIYTEAGQIKVTPETIQKHGPIDCNVTYLKRKDDFTNEEDHVTTLTGDMVLENDFFKIYCNSSTNHQYDNVHIGIARNNDILQRKLNKDVKEHGLGLDILILGYDSVSRLSFKRKLPKSYDYLINTLGAEVLEGYNIVGDGTPQALIPILTGKTEVELPVTLKRMANPEPVDSYPMIWKDLKRNGYVTAWSEDQPSIGTFTYRMIGFKEAPVDHYARPFHIVGDAEKSKHKRLCFGSRRRTQVFLDWLKEFYSMYQHKSKFAFGFQSEVSHDDVNLVETADDDTHNFLSTLYEGGYLNNTMLIVMSDHGARFSDLRKTLQGKLEERMPFFSLTFPKWIYKKYPQAFANLKINKQRLTTPFDIYPTMLDVLDFKGSGQGNIKERGISLFKEIPEKRTCTDAAIDLHWCACLNWIKSSLGNPIIINAVHYIVDYINNILEIQKDKCAKLDVYIIKEALEIQQQKEVLRFKQSKDVDGRESDFSDHTKVTLSVYQITLVTIPGKGMFQTTINYNLETKNYYLTESDISRINRYGTDPKCIYDTNEQLRKYCYCIN